MEVAQTEHEQALARLAHDEELRRQEEDQKQQLDYERRRQAVDLERMHAEHEERLGFLRQMQGMQVDLTRYLVAQYQHPDRLIRLDGVTGGQLHLHEN